MVEIVMCPRDPGVETALRCSRCEQPICPKCLVQSPVGSRCKDCAQIFKSPIYHLTRPQLAKAIGAALVGGVVMGLVWGFVLYQFQFGFLAIFLGAFLGWVFTRLMDFATGSRRGNQVVACAIGGLIIAWGMQFLFVPPRVAMFGVLALGVGIYFSYQKLSRL